MRALVLSGGSIKGAWQAGAIERVLASGYTPDIVTGISVGALNAAYLAHFGLNGHAISEFWENRVTRPADVIRKRKWYELVWRLITNRWDGLVDTTPLATLVKSTLSGDVDPFLVVDVGAVNLQTGALVYTPSTDPNFIDAVLASAAVPITMPVRRIAGEPYYDGGARDITPLAQAIHLGATEIVAIVCQPAATAPRELHLGKVTELIDRVLDIITNEIMLNDIDTLLAINELVKAGKVEDKQFIPFALIQPERAIGVDITSFNQADIRAMVEQGRADADRVLGAMDLLDAYDASLCGT